MWPRCCSISDANLVTTGQVNLYPRGINFDGYKAVLENKEIWRSYANSIFYTVGAALMAGAAILLVTKKKLANQE